MPTRSPRITLFYAPFTLLSKGACLLGMVLLMGGSLLGSNPAHAQPSLLFGPDGEGGGQSAHAGPKPPVGEIWSAEVRGGSVAIGENGTAVSNTEEGLIAIGPDGEERWRTDAPGFVLPQRTRTGTVHYLDLKSQSLHARTFAGSEKWTFDLKKLEGGPAGLMADDKGTSYVLKGDRKGPVSLYAIGSSGTMKWQLQPSRPAKRFTLNDEFPPMVTGEDGTVYVIASPASGYGETLLLAVGPDGKEKWRFDESRLNLEQLVVGNDGTVYAWTTRGEKLYAIGADGTEKWQFEEKGKRTLLSPPATGDDGTVYLASSRVMEGEDNSVTHLRALGPDGTEKWKWRLENGSTTYSTRGEKPTVGVAPSIGRDGTIYIALNVEEEDYLYAVTPKGEEKWRFKMDAPIGRAPTIGAEGTLYAATAETLYAISPDGEEQWRFGMKNSPVSSPVVVNETAYVFTEDTLYSIGTVEN